MRFAAVPMPPAQPQRTPAAEFLRRLVAPDAQPRLPAQRQEEPPCDLDQRVRLAGEW